ncbi:unnamed protein product, partial [Closterium sp. NIES-54]
VSVGSPIPISRTCKGRLGHACLAGSGRGGEGGKRTSRGGQGSAVAQASVPSRLVSFGGRCEHTPKHSGRP